MAFQLFRGLEFALAEREFYGLSVLVLCLSDKLLDENIDLRLQVSKEAYQDMNRGPNYEAHWPLGATEELLSLEQGRRVLGRHGQLVAFRPRLHR